MKGYKIEVGFNDCKGVTFDYAKYFEKAVKKAKKMRLTEKKVRDKEITVKIIEKELNKCMSCGNLTENNHLCLRCEKIQDEVQDE